MELNPRRIFRGGFFVSNEKWNDEILFFINTNEFFFRTKINSFFIYLFLSFFFLYKKVHTNTKLYYVLACKTFYCMETKSLFYPQKWIKCIIILFYFYYYYKLIASLWHSSVTCFSDDSYNHDARITTSKYLFIMSYLSVKKNNMYILYYIHSWNLSTVDVNNSIQLKKKSYFNEISFPVNTYKIYIC